MKTETFRTRPLNILHSERSSQSQSHSQSHSQTQSQSRHKPKYHIPVENLRASLLTSDDRDSVGKAASATGRGKRIRSRIIPMKGITKKTKTMDYTNYAYNEAVGRLKLMLADSYATPKTSSSSYLRNINDDSTDNCSDTISVIERPVFADISKYLSPGYKSRILLQTSYRPKKLFDRATSSSSFKDPLPVATTPTSTPMDSVQTPGEIFNFIEKQEDYIEQLEKESHYCRSELSHLLGKVKEVISENEQLTEQARSEFAALSGAPNPSSDSEESRHVDTQQYLVSKKKIATSRSLPSALDREKKKESVKSPRYANAPSIVYEAKISELEAELMQAQIDLKRLQTENEELKRQNADPVRITGSASINACEAHHKQVEQMQQERHALEETIRQLHKLLDEAKSNQYSESSKRYVHDLLQMERSQAELEVKHLRDELDRQHERVRELQHEMARRLADERANAERRYNNQVDQLGGDLSSQWEQVTKLQLEQERQKRYEADLKRELAQRNAQIDELKMELKSNRTTFQADMAQMSAERQSLEQEITALRLQLDRSAREAKTEATRLNAEINSLRQRLDRGDADLLHSKREVLRLNDEIANLEKELAYGELKNEIRPTKKDLDKRISDIQDKHVETVNELEEMIQNQKLLMDKLTNECKILTNKLEEATLKNNQEKHQLRDINEKLMLRLKQIWASYKELNAKRDERLESCREEHFTSAAENTLAKPLSTTILPSLVQPPMTTTRLHTVMNPYSESHLHPSYYPQQKLQIQQQKSQKNHAQETMISTNRNMSLTQQQQKQMHPKSTTRKSASKMTMRISRTKWEWVKSKSNAQKPISAQPPSRPTTPPVSTTSTTVEPPNDKRMTQTTTATITAPTPTTINSNTIRVPTTPATSNNNTMSSSSNNNNCNTVAVGSTTTTDSRTITKATMSQIMSSNSSNLPTNMKQQLIHQQILPSSTATTPPPQQCPLKRRPRRPLIVWDSPRMLRAAQQQRAAYNRERAAALWGQQLLMGEESVSTNPLCHNSLPRQQPRSSSTPESAGSETKGVVDREEEVEQETWGCKIDPFEMDFSISSPSLMRSCSNSSNGELDSEEFDSITDMSISPAQTVIRR